MDVLSAQSLADAFTRCYENRHYKVCVAFDSTVTYIPFINELNKCYNTDTWTPSIPGVVDVKCSNFETRILFYNGSIVEIFVLRENVRAKRCNEIIYDDNINDNRLTEILRPMLVTYKNLKDSTAENIDTDSEALDEFPNGFKIVG